MTVHKDRTEPSPECSGLQCDCEPPVTPHWRWLCPYAELPPTWVCQVCFDRACEFPRGSRVTLHEREYLPMGHRKRLSQLRREAEM